MATEAQQAANRKNARRGTGPKSTSGKRRVSQNAMRHGLTARVLGVAPMTAYIAALEDAVIGSVPRDATIDSLAHAAADAHYVVQQVRNYRRAQYVEQKIYIGDDETRFADHEGWMDCVRKLVGELGRLDRYERRAISRRRRALRDLAAYLARRETLSMTGTNN